MTGLLCVSGRPTLTLLRNGARTSWATASRHSLAKNTERSGARVFLRLHAPSRFCSASASGSPEESAAEAMPAELNTALTILERGVPESMVHTGRTLILCFDGTSGYYHGRNTNVVRLFSCLEKRESQQLVYYQTGIGTSTRSRFGIRFSSWISKMIDQGIAWHLEDNVCSGYHFLQVNWRPGDKICVFGFSRGAYIARALAGMIQTVGLLPETVPEQVEFAYKLYKTLGRGGSTSNHISRDYKRDFSRHVVIDFLGVWDTVGSAGLVFPQSLPFSRTSHTIKVFRQALALDERRVRFIPSTWALSVEERTLANGSWRTTKLPADFAAPNYTTFENLRHWVLGMLNLPFELLYSSLVRWLPEPLKNMRPNSQPKEESKAQRCLIPAGSTSQKWSPPDVKEVWFAGGHADVGGGNSRDTVRVDGGSIAFPALAYVPALSNISLRWMIHELYEADKRYNLNIRWRPVQLARFGISLPQLPLTNNEYAGCSTSPKTHSNGSTPTLRPGIPAPPTQEPVTVHYIPTPEAANMRRNDPRRAEFTRCLKYESGVLIDLKYYEADLSAPITDQLWMWERIWKWGMQEMRDHPNPYWRIEWATASATTLLTMMLWWFLELWPYVKGVRNGTRYFWQSRFEMGINMFRGRQIPQFESVVLPQGASRHWKEFVEDRRKVQVHSSVLQRVRRKDLGYRPRPWPKEWKKKGSPDETWKVAH
ncbi:uncharacterized protein EI90DRAFT_1098640 [Cantharellus anzutake]|uniref:uncharacterized protein n=1 Tax=Cantharellus anzutake TaxID=1750568 RepID=UPI001904E78C|nr:uncharacterized protein EI90DRAFT_1098640 [Cantharellus anzutake]KAF8330819.1 hypothetical protein EI90DRAFT_1098640 [Cantharellus anzutake]